MDLCRRIRRARIAIIVATLLAASLAASEVLALSCPGTPPAPPPSGVCSITTGSAARLLQGHVLGEDGEFVKGGHTF